MLGVERGASDAEMKAAYRKLAMQHHPDRNPGDKDCEHRFKEINEAYDVLKDGDKRAAYDRFGHAAFEQGMGGGQHGFGADFGSAFSDIFEGIFGMGGARQRSLGPRARRRPALQHGDHARGGVRRQDRAGAAADLGDLRVLLRLGRQGRHQAEGLPALQRPRPHPPHPGRFFTLERTCPICQGRGQVIEDPCPTCSGSGRVTRERTLSVNIPPGVEDGTRIRLAGEGEAGVRGGPAGDLYIFLSLAAHEFFQRDGADLHCRVPISMVTAALGGEFEVPSIDGSKSRVKVPAGTQSGRRFRLGGKGMPVLRSKQSGDMYVQVVVETPQNLTKRQRELLAEFEKLSSQETQPEAAGFFARVKDFFGNGARSG